MFFQNIGTYVAVFSCYIGTLTVAFIIGFPSPTQKKILQEYQLDEHTLPVFASISHITRIIGIISTTILAEFGSQLKTITVINCLSGVVGYVLIIISDSPTYIIISSWPFLTYLWQSIT